MKKSASTKIWYYVGAKCFLFLLENSNLVEKTQLFFRKKLDLILFTVKILVKNKPSGGTQNNAA
jgi:hypothetical protein